MHDYEDHYFPHTSTSRIKGGKPMKMIGLNEELEVSNSKDIYCENEGRITRHYPSGDSWKCISCGNKNGLNTENVQAANLKVKQLLPNKTVPQTLIDDKDFCEVVRKVFQKADRLYELIQDNDEVRFAIDQAGVEALDILNSFEKAVEAIDDDHRKALDIFVPIKPDYAQALANVHKKLIGHKPPKMTREEMKAHHTEEAAVGNV